MSGDMYKGVDDETEPSWVNSEREQFSQFRDKDGDGYMDKEEVNTRDILVSVKIQH